jgi:hypothetical protein
VDLHGVGRICYGFVVDLHRICLGLLWTCNCVMGLQWICCGFANDLHGFVVDLLRICNVCVMGLQLFVCICCPFVCICIQLRPKLGTA